MENSPAWNLVYTRRFFQPFAKDDPEEQFRFITHGGLNSVSEAMVHGVPMVVIPFVSDQPVNVRQVEKMGLGKVQDYKGVTADILKETAMEVMKDTQIRENLRNIQEEIVCVPGNAGAVGVIETYSRR